MALFAVAVLAVILVDPNDYKPQIAAAVQGATGRTLTLDGPVRISRSLWPTIEASNLKLANLPGGSRPDMATIERIEARLSLPALFSRRLEILRLTLVGPNILFEEVAQKPNWEFRAAGPAAAPSSQAAGPSGATLRFRDVHVENGMVTFRLPARTKVVGIRSLDFHHLKDGGPLDVASVLVYSDNQPFRLAGSAQPTGDVTDPWNTQLRFEADGAAASAKGPISLAGGYDLQVDGTAAQLEKLNALLPEMRLPALHQVDVATHLTNGPVRGDLPVIGATRLQVGSADLGDRVPGLRLGTVAVSLTAAGGAAAISGEGSYAGQPFDFDGKAVVPQHLDGPAALPIDLTARAPAAANGNAAGGAQGSVTVNGRLALNTGRFDGLDAAIALRTPALARARPMVSARLSALTNLSLDGRLVIPADVGSLTLHDARLSAHEAEVSGAMTIERHPVIAAKAQLRSTRLDMDAVLAAFGSGTPSPPGGGVAADDPATPVFSHAPLPWAMLRGPVLDLKAAVTAVTYRQQDWQNIELALQLRNGLLKVGRLSFELDGGPLAASLSADASLDDPAVSLVLHSPGIKLAPLARHAGLSGTATGAIRLDADLHAVGKSPHDLAASLAGPVAATVIGGSVSNAALIQLAAGPLKTLSIDVPAKGETTIRCFRVVGSFTKGTGRFSTIAVDTTYLSLNGAGQVDLGAETMALKLYPLARLSGALVAVPVLVEGPLRAVQGRLDASGLDKLGLLIDAWLGGDRPQTCADDGLVPPPRAGGN